MRALYAKTSIAMNDPYKTPASNVQINESKSKTKWKVFFWLLLLLEIASIVVLAIDTEKTAFDLAFELIVYIIILVGVYGFSYDRKILSRQLWVSMIPLGLCYDMYMFYNFDWRAGSTGELYFTIGLTAVIILPIMYFQYLALYKYSFRSPEIWN